MSKIELEFKDEDGSWRVSVDQEYGAEETAMTLMKAMMGETEAANFKITTEPSNAK